MTADATFSAAGKDLTFPLVEASEGSNADDEHDTEGQTIAWDRAQNSALVDATKERIAEIIQANSQVADGPFVVLNSDSFWLEGPSPNLSRLIDAWDGESMDMLLLVAPTATSLGYEGAGDFLMDADGRLERRGERAVAPFIYAGVAIVKPELFADTPEGAFSLNLLFDRAIDRGRLFGTPLDGQWLHVGTPEAITAAAARNAAMNDGSSQP